MLNGVGGLRVGGPDGVERAAADGHEVLEAGRKDVGSDVGRVLCGSRPRAHGGSVGPRRPADEGVAGTRGLADGEEGFGLLALGSFDARFGSADEPRGIGIAREDVREGSVIGLVEEREREGVLGRNGTGDDGVVHTEGGLVGVTVEAGVVLLGTENVGNRSGGIVGRNAAESLGDDLLCGAVTGNADVLDRVLDGGQGLPDGIQRQVVARHLEVEAADCARREERDALGRKDGLGLVDVVLSGGHVGAGVGRPAKEGVAQALDVGGTGQRVELARLDRLGSVVGARPAGAARGADDQRQGLVERSEVEFERIVLGKLVDGERALVAGVREVGIELVTDDGEVLVRLGRRDGGVDLGATLLALVQTDAPLGG